MKVAQLEAAALASTAGFTGIAVSFCYVSRLFSCLCVTEWRPEVEKLLKMATNAVKPLTDSATAAAAVRLLYCACPPCKHVAYVYVYVHAG